MDHMQQLVEGLKQYYKKPDVKDAFFISTEYEMIHQNALSCFLPMQMRTQDGQYEVLYEVTGAASVLDLSKSQTFRLDFCKNLIRQVINLLETADNYMLSIDRVLFQPDRVFVTKDEKIQWFYLPDESFEVEKEAEEFFAWILAKLDYVDQEAIRLMFQVYDVIRKYGLNEEKLRQCLKEKQHIWKTEDQYKTMGIREEKKEKKEKKERYNKTQRSKEATKGDCVILKPKRKSRWPFPVIIHNLPRSIVICSVPAELYLISIGLRKGFVAILLRYMAGVFVIILLCVMIMIRSRNQQS